MTPGKTHIKFNANQIPEISPNILGMPLLAAIAKAARIRQASIATAHISRFTVNRISIGPRPTGRGHGTSFRVILAAERFEAGKFRMVSVQFDLAGN